LLKTLLMPSEPIRALSGVNVPGFPMAGFQLTLYGRIWVTPEAASSPNTPPISREETQHLCKRLRDVRSELFAIDFELKQIQKILGVKIIWRDKMSR